MLKKASWYGIRQICAWSVCGVWMFGSCRARGRDHLACTTENNKPVYIIMVLGNTCKRTWKRTITSDHLIGMQDSVDSIGSSARRLLRGGCTT